MAMNFHFHLLFLACCAAAKFTWELPPAVDLQVNHVADPVAISNPSPLLSWKLALSEGARGVTQTAYQIQVIDSDDGTTVWDTGKMARAGVRQVRYNGNALKPFHLYRWHVQWWSGNLSSSPSSPSNFTVGPQTADDWHNATLLGHANQTQLRCTFALSHSNVTRAIAHVLAPGCYVMEANGHAVGDAFGQCPWLQYDKRIMYQSVDVTAALVDGNNALGVILGRGFYLRANFNTVRVFKMLLVVTYANGNRQYITSNIAGSASAGRWLQRPSYTVNTDIWLGNEVNYTSYEPGWSTVAWQPSSAWQSVQASPPLDPAITIEAMNMQTSVSSSLMSAINFTRLPNGDAVYDFGANIVGSTEFHGVIPAGAMLTIVHGEILNQDGSVNNSYVHGPLQVDQYIGAANSPSTSRGVFSWHGFQYAQLHVTNWSEFEPTARSISAFKVNSNLKQTGFSGRYCI
eukprot:TRINITY_DN11283_c0_g1_i1.p1 TRINITY_DN11283_c0_g1~~TRINITY_DN11283_c0_g1_i1.p1  ORF type:complete len:459 (+),score=82.22 TRINITY_DN11283_c0_g1_i1:262-1638(+)